MVNPDWKKLRRKMVSDQIMSRGIQDKAILKAMLKVPRHAFVGTEEMVFAYEDHPLPIGWGQTISQPYIVAVMSQMLQAEPGQKVLEIGTGCGYQSAILAEMGLNVYSIEIVPQLYELSKMNLSKLGFTGIFLKCGDGRKGWPEEAPFDRILAAAAPANVPPPLCEQLAEGGVMVLPVGDYSQRLKKIRKINGHMLEENGIPVRFVPMTHS